MVFHYFKRKILRASSNHIHLTQDIEFICQHLTMELRRDHMLDLSSLSPEQQAILGSAPDFDHGDMDFNDPATIAGLSGMPIPPTMEPSALQQRARAMTNDIFKDYDLLRKIRMFKLDFMALDFGGL